MTTQNPSEKDPKATTKDEAAETKQELTDAQIASVAGGITGVGTAPVKPTPLPIPHVGPVTG